MKTTRVLSLLFSLCQFLLFLKFVELVQGDIIPLSEGSINGSNTSNREQRHFFVAPRVKERKFKPWLSSTSTESPRNSTQEDSYVDSDGSITYNKTQSDRIDLQFAEDNPNNSSSSNESSSGRLCPGCEGGTCGATTTTSYKFPGIPLIIALAVGVIWFFAFLFFFYFMIDPSSAQPAGYPASMGYGYGGGHDNGWTQSGSSSQGGLGGIASLLSMFTGSNQRSYSSVNSLTANVLNAVNTLAQIYSQSE